MANFVGEIILVGFNFAPNGWALCDGQLLPIAENDVLFQLIGTTYGGDGVTTFALPDLRGRVPIHQGQGPGLSNTFIGENDGAETVTLTASQIPAHTHAIDLSAMTVTARCRNSMSNQATPINAVPAATEPPPTFADSPLAVGVTGVKTVHITELRTRINGLRARYGLAAFSFADPALTAGTTPIKSQHITELRSALAAVYAQAGLTQPTYTDPVITAGTTGLKAVHITELRSRCDALSGVYSAAPDANMNGGAIAIGGLATASATGGSQPHDNMQPYLGLNFCISLFGVFPSQS